MLGWLVEREIVPHIPVFDKSGRSDGTWTRADFDWDAGNDQYICPEPSTSKPSHNARLSDHARKRGGIGRSHGVNKCADGGSVGFCRKLGDPKIQR